MQSMTESGTGHPLGRKLILWTLHLLMRLLFRFEVSHPEYVPARGPVVVIINHIAFLDPVLVCGIFPRLTPMAKKEADDSLLIRPFVRGYGAILVDRSGMDIRAIKQALRVLKAGGGILIAPEGTRSRTYQLQPAKEGAILMAVRSGAPIVPIGVTGAQRVKVHWSKLRRPLIRMNVGPAFRLQSPTAGNHPDRAELAAMTREAMYRLAAQLPPEFRGVYSHAEEATEVYVAAA